jgi:hypothetical protein
MLWSAIRTHQATFARDWKQGKRDYIPPQYRLPSALFSHLFESHEEKATRTADPYFLDVGALAWNFLFQKRRREDDINGRLF